MKLRKGDSPSLPQRGSGIVSPKANRGSPSLKVDETVLSDSVMRGLIDDWLVPAIVERVIRNLESNEE